MALHKKENHNPEQPACRRHRPPLAHTARGGRRHRHNGGSLTGAASPCRHRHQGAMANTPHNGGLPKHPRGIAREVRHPAGQLQIDNQFHELLENGNLLPIGKQGNHLLVETSYFTPPMQLNETLQRIKSKGYHPLLAHPERYMYMDNSRYRTLHESGVKMQLNILSLAGAYGRAVAKKAAWLLKNNMYTAAGSDLHCSDALEIINATPLNKEQCSALQELLHTNL